MIVEYGTTTLVGQIDGVNKAFRLSHRPKTATLMVYHNGICLDPSFDNGWYMNGPSLLSLAEPPEPGDTVIVAYDLEVPPVAPPVTPVPTPPAGPLPPLNPSEYGLAQSNYPPGGVASLLAPTIIGSSAFGVAGDLSARGAVFSLKPHIIQTQVF